MDTGKQFNDQKTQNKYKEVTAIKMRDTDLTPKKR